VLRRWVKEKREEGTESAPGRKTWQRVINTARQGCRAEAHACFRREGRPDAEAVAASRGRAAAARAVTAAGSGQQGLLALPDVASRAATRAGRQRSRPSPIPGCWQDLWAADRHRPGQLPCVWGRRRPAQAWPADAQTRPRCPPKVAVTTNPRRPATHTKSGVPRGSSRVEKGLSPLDAITATLPVCGSWPSVRASHPRRLTRPASGLPEPGFKNKEATALFA